MKKILIIISLIILVGITGFMYVQNSTDQVQPGEIEKNNNFPDIDSTRPVSAQNIIIEIADGGTIEVSNFLVGSDVIIDSMNEGHYFLGNQFPTVDTPRSDRPAYIIDYNSEISYFNIALLEEPLNDSRQQAEAYIKNRLGFTEEQMCSLKYTVSVPYTVNDYFSGRNLGFSFCSGSFPLE